MKTIDLKQLEKEKTILIKEIHPGVNYILSGNLNNISTEEMNSIAVEEIHTVILVNVDSVES